MKPGDSIGPYHVLGKLGEGGMGEVYRARDTKLKREVAVKILPEAWAGDPERLARFQREAEMLAALNHPHIAAIYGLEDGGGVNALVMELIEGEDLAQRLARGPIPIDESLTIAGQIAEALEAAHDVGVIHRDLKPANIRVRPDGTVKVLDFGLAKLSERDSPAAAEYRAQSPTITTPALTQLGVFLGTAAYMSPEQARGRAADKRSDIWAFGCVLFEMIAGRRAFAPGDTTITDVIAAVLKSDPDWGLLPAGTPVPVRRLLRRCLVKDPRGRLHDIADARLELADAHIAEPVIAAAGPRRPWLAWSMVAALATLCAVLAFLLQRASLTTEPPVAAYRSTILPPVADANAAASEALTGLPRFARGLALSPDGRRLAFVAPGMTGVVMLWIRELSGGSEHALAGTEGAALPFWAPDGRRIGFVADRKLKVVDADGGPVSSRYDGARVSGGTWNREDVILFREDGEIRRLAVGGGSAIKVAELDEGSGPPHFLPDGRRFLYATGSAAGTASGGIYAGTLGSSERIKLRDDGFLPAYGNGFLVFVRGDTLMAQRLDPDRLTLSGEAMPVIGDVQVGGAPSARASFAISQTGVLVYQAGVIQRSELVWTDRSGKTLAVVSDPQDFSYVQLSPNGRHVAISRMDESSRNRDVWLYDTTRTGQNRLTDQPTDDFAAVWSPNSDRLAFAGRRAADRGLNLYELSESGGNERRLLERDGIEVPTSWSADGRFILFQSEAPASDISMLRLADSTVTPFAATRHTEGTAQFSPDGRRVVYVSSQSGRLDVFVAPFQRTGRAEPISAGGGSSPRWRRDGKELFYLRSDNTLMAVAVRLTESSIEVGRTQELFRASFRLNAFPYDVSTDGRFLINRGADDATANTPITLVVNWPALLKRE